MTSVSNGVAATGVHTCQVDRAEIRPQIHSAHRGVAGGQGLVADAGGYKERPSRRQYPRLAFGAYREYPAGRPGQLVVLVLVPVKDEPGRHLEGDDICRLG